MIRNCTFINFQIYKIISRTLERFYSFILTHRCRINFQFLTLNTFPTMITGDRFSPEGMTLYSIRHRKRKVSCKRNMNYQIHPLGKKEKRITNDNPLF